MDWANERYVRLYTRDTVTWKMLCWQAKALLPLILRKLDRSGVLDIGEYGIDAVAAIAEVPVDFLQAGLPDLIKHGVVTMHDGRLVMPKYIQAQEARQSDAQRQRDSRERRAASRDKQSQSVTGGDQQSHHDVTSGHAESLQPSLAEPSLAEGSRARARSTQNAKIRPRSGQDLITCLRVAVEREQPENGIWNPGGSFAHKEARDFLIGFGEALEEALDTIERRIDAFARNTKMKPWTVARFAKEYNGIEAGTDAPFRWHKAVST